MSKEQEICATDFLVRLELTYDVVIDLFLKNRDRDVLEMRNVLSVLFEKFADKNGVLTYWNLQDDALVGIRTRDIYDMRVYPFDSEGYLEYDGVLEDQMFL